MPTTEMVVLPMKAGSNIGDPSHPSASTLKQTCQTLVGPAQSQQVHFGTIVEEPHKLRLFIDWDSLPKHQEFMAADIYKDFQGTIRTMAGGPPQIRHADFQPAGALDKALSAPVTEIVTVYFDGDVPADYGSNIEKMIELTKDVQSTKAIAWGSTYETVEHEGVKGKAAVVAVGWTSIEDHHAFRETELFKECGPYLRSSSKAITAEHVQAMKFVE